jgi:hypothetical protein
VREGAQRYLTFWGVSTEIDLRREGVKCQERHEEEERRNMVRSLSGASTEEW